MDLIPTEVIDIILQYLIPKEGGLYDLWQSSLVCRAWRVPAQRIVFRQIHIRWFRNWKRLQRMAEINPTIGSYVRTLFFEMDADPGDPWASTLFPNVTSIKFKSRSDVPRLGIASRFPRLTSMNIVFDYAKRLPYSIKVTPLSIPPRAPIALRVLRCSYSGLQEVLQWLATSDTLKERSLRTVSIACDEVQSNIFSHPMEMYKAESQAALVNSFLQRYNSISQLEINIPEVQGVHLPPHVFSLGQYSNIVSLRLVTTESNCPAILDLFRTCKLHCLRTLELHFHSSVACSIGKVSLWDEHPIPRTERLEKVVIRAVAWRYHSRKWYEHLAALFGSANRQGVMHLEISDRIIRSNYEEADIDDDGNEIEGRYDPWSNYPPPDKWYNLAMNSDSDVSEYEGHEAETDHEDDGRDLAMNFVDAYD